MTDNSDAQSREKSLKQALLMVQEEANSSREKIMLRNPKLPKDAISPDSYLKVLKTYEKTAGRAVANLSDAGLQILFNEFGMNISSRESWRLKWFTRNHQRVKSSVTGTIASFEGMSCSADKFYTLFRLYMKIEIELRQGSPMVPFFVTPYTDATSWAFVSEGSIVLWIAYLDAFPHFDSGNIQPLLDAHSALKEHYDNLSLNS